MSGLNEAATDDLDDRVYPFQVDKIGVRGRLVRLGGALDEILSTHDYPLQVSELLGEAIALCVALSSTLKFEGLFSLQVRGNGAVRAIVADFETPGAIRGYASYDDTALAAGAGGAEDVTALFGQGYLTWTVDQGGDTQRYQGIVPLEGASLAACLEAYFRRSEQLRAVVRVGVAREERPGGEVRWRGGAIMAQNIAAQGGRGGQAPANVVDEADWQHASALVGSTTPLELCDPALLPEGLLRRLFHEDGVWMYDPTMVEARCRCSRERIDSVLRQFSADEIAEMITESGNIEVRCEFCSKLYHFDGESRLATGQA